VPYPYQHWQPESVLQDCSASASERPVQIPGRDATIPASCGDHRDDHRDDRGPAPVDWHGRGVDQGRFDHQPFNWMGQQVNPVQSGDGNGWGFWFLGQWIPL
jgi:hypothetical protein